jgi:hypothetical protein
MLWHGAAIYHLPQQYASSSTVPTELSLLFYDLIVSDDTKQDMWSVASLIEAIMMRIRRDLWDVKEIVLVSDNASGYQNQVLPSLLSFLAATVGIQIISLLPRRGAGRQEHCGRPLCPCHASCKQIREGRARCHLLEHNSGVSI